MNSIHANRGRPGVTGTILAAGLLCAATLGSTLACGRYGPPRWTAGAPIPTASENSIQPEPAAVQEIGEPAGNEEEDNPGTSRP